MPEKTKPDLLNSALAQLEDIVAELEFIDDLIDSDKLLVNLKVDRINLESGAELSRLKNLESLNKTIPPKK